MTTAATVPSIDWKLAESTGRRMIPAGPQLPIEQIRGIVAEVRDAALRAEPHVREVTEFTAPLPDSRILVVDRRRWVSVNVASTRVVLEHAGSPRPTGLVQRTQAALVGSQLGAAFSWVGQKVLGQYDPFGPEPALLLVAPNIAQAERELNVDVHDFRLWVCLHEQTHRFQFAEAPWLREHLLGLAAEVLDPGAEEEVPPSASPRQRTLLDLVTTPAQRRAVDSVTAVMSLLEGHADVMMDRVGAEVVPSVAQIRARFDRRRMRGGVDKVMRRLLGLDLKLAQYRDGSRFCRTVIERIGVNGLNEAFRGPGYLPTREEIHTPAAWIERMSR